MNSLEEYCRLMIKYVKFKNIPNEYKTEEICLKSFMECDTSDYIPKRIKTYDFYLKAYSNNYNYYPKIPINFLDEYMIILIICKTENLDIFNDYIITDMPKDIFLSKEKVEKHVSPMKIMRRNLNENMAENYNNFKNNLKKLSSINSREYSSDKIFFEVLSKNLDLIRIIPKDYRNDNIVKSYINAEHIKGSYLNGCYDISYDKIKRKTLKLLLFLCPYYIRDIPKDKITINNCRLVFRTNKELSCISWEIFYSAPKKLYSFKLLLFLCLNNNYLHLLRPLSFRTQIKLKKSLSYYYF
jgi:hypothetical protein